MKETLWEELKGNANGEEPCKWGGTLAQEGENKGRISERK